MAGFIRFSCGNCGSQMKVPSAFAGKRVKCPGCQKPAGVPSGAAAEAGASELSAMDLSALDDNDGVSGTGAAGRPRRIRDMLVGCGACEKTVKIPENRCGSVVRCPKCDTPLKVDCPAPPPGTGKTVDFRHVRLEPLDDPSLDGADGTLAGSVAGLSAAGAGSAAGGASGAFELQLEDAGASAAGGDTSGRDQMAELRTLNDLLAEGSISKDEYKKRRAEVMAGGSATGAAARAASSRAVGGASVQSLKVKRGFRVPGFVKALLGLAFLGGAGYAVYVLGVAPFLEGMAEEEPAVVSLEPEATADPDEGEPEPEAEEVAAPVGPPAVLMVTPGVPVQPWTGAPAGEASGPATPLVDTEPAGNGASTPAGRLGGLLADAQAEAAGRAGAATGTLATEPTDAASAAAAVPTPTDPASTPSPPRPPAVGGGAEAPGAVAFWPVMFPEVRSTFALAIASAKVMRMSRSDGEADFGLVLGPALGGDAADAADPELLRFNFEMRRQLINGLGTSGEWRPMDADDKPRRYGPFNEVLYTEVRGRSASRQGEAIVVAVASQDGRAVAYWFSGKSRLLAQFERDALGTAVLE